MLENFEKIAGSMINVILGALILWVGQTTYRHAGVLASLDQKFEAVDLRFKDVGERYDSLRTWLDKVVNNIKDDSRLQFTTEDAEKLNEQLRKLDEYTYHVEQRIADRLNAVEMKVAALEAHGQDSQQVAALQTEIAQLRFAIGQQSLAAPDAQYQAASGMARSAPVYLPPVNTRR